MDVKATAESNVRLINNAMSSGDSLLSLHSLWDQLGKLSLVSDSWIPIHLARCVFLAGDPNFLF